jgi:copper chaperone CopZ
MKNLKFKLSIFTVFSVILISAILLSGCTKQDKKETSDSKDKKTEDVQKTDNSQQDISTLMNQEEIKTNADDKNKKENENKDNAKLNIENKTIKIPSAQCETCKENITKALKKVNGIKSYDVDIDNKIVSVNFDKEVTDLSKIENAITSAGYDANNKKANPDAYAKLDDCCKKPEDRKK